ncbi:MAG: hypothetical protein RIB84_22505 [Sneathiellaceae bacterium]
MTGWSEIKTADRRLCILRLLDEEKDGGLGEGLLQQALAPLQHRVSREEIREDLRWLAEARLVAVTSYGAEKLGAEILLRGHEAALGLVEIEGVARPSRRA